MREIVLATGNEHKIKEIQRMFGNKDKLLGLGDIGFNQDIVEDGETFKDNSFIKARAVFDYLRSQGKSYPVLAEDSGLCCSGIGGEPGVNSARYAGGHGNNEANRKKLLEKLKDKPDRSAFFVCVATYMDENGHATYGEGRTAGYVLEEPRGNNGFAYDPIFFSLELNKCFGEATGEEKDSVSHRRRAIEEVINKLENKKKGCIQMDKWDKRFMEMTDLVGTWSSCLRHGVGAVIVKNKRIMTTGYNGAPAGVKSCAERGECLRNKLNIASGTRAELCYAVHAEQNAIIQAAKLGVNIDGGTLYCTHQPCSMCTRIIINAGIKRVVYRHPYPDEFSHELFREAGVELVQYQE